ncbi:MAG: adenylosuccinate synthetase [Candidatus Omnitrophota bacterium]|jgi:adenylosuccinate synthase|nr:MAG: adenylosuccinate synthetase [Candidatus Omnitrophota bacterium]
MPCNIIVGGQYGSEGKGKVVALLSQELNNPFVVRCGGPNSGHTVTIEGNDIILRHIPAGVVKDDATLLLSAGCIIDEGILVNELDVLRIPPERIIVDPRAILIEPDDKKRESADLNSIASTCSGTGYAQIRRIKRKKESRLAKNSSVLRERCRVETVAPLIHEHLDHEGHVLVEGTQGFGLSLYHGFEYPYVTSRDTTAAGFAMEVGLSPIQIDHVTLVIRTFPIRVGGTSGPLKDEISWDEIKELSDAPNVIPEFTSVTKRLRRVAQFDLEAVKKACLYNRPTGIALMGLDRLDYRNYEISHYDQLAQKGRDFIDYVEYYTSVPVIFAGTGFKTHDAIKITSKVNVG